ncbi:Conserved hypothetical protein [Shewanella piezotolerans WP3]|uniref:IrrE N-terminal-like domain-containing protein n=1 Tax=Shewanella piezotolerans (strain WP3 / JCM 13877) TaxID=225849 RepID=B8CUD4_SHEPW|nr:ImmA/IrrE family metallo-endopeptidase [Shewanella piezotolerans]ACJ31126.1 Conserved hypothetical protein [Shewanella piezotolerans WP3]
MIKEKHGAAEAEYLLEELEINTLPIIPKEVVKAIDSEHYRVVLEPQSFKSESILGKAEGNNDGALIYVNANIKDEGRYNFTVAHELGHVVLHIMNRKKLSFECGKDAFKSYYNDPSEREANGFASGLLMPKQLISPLTDGDINWRNISTIKRECKTSLEASFRRLCSLSHEPAALVIHKKDRFHRFASSEQFDFYIEQIPLTIDKKDLCSNGLADELFAEFEEMDASDWVNPCKKGLTIDRIYASSISLANDITYTLLKYDDDCLSDSNE